MAATTLLATSSSHFCPSAIIVPELSIPRFVFALLSLASRNANKHRAIDKVQEQLISIQSQSSPSTNRGVFNKNNKDVLDDNDHALTTTTITIVANTVSQVGLPAREH